MKYFPTFTGDELHYFEDVELPKFDESEIDEALIEAELSTLPHLSTDQRFEEPLTVERLFRTQTAETAAETLGCIPGPNQAIHLVVNGRFALWDFVTATLKLAGEGITINQLHLVTLGFSRKNIAELCVMLDANKIRSVWLLCSHYFKGTSGGIYEYAEAELAARHQRFASCRTHAKIVLIRLSDDRTVTFESSANLRSCKNIEQVVTCGLPGLYRFHAQWMEPLFK